MLEQREEEGERIIEGVEASFAELEESPRRRKNVAAEGLINDAREHVQEIEEGPALDAVLIGDIQKTEHYCIATWGTARTLAQAMKQKTAVRTMERALKEGKTLDEELTQLSETEITPALLSEGSREQQEQGGRQGRSRRTSGSGRYAAP
jgi:ferritin-like metal-binding protein YciE